MPSSSTAISGIWDVIAREATRESDLWTGALRPPEQREHAAVFSPLASARFAVGLETIYEGYLAHYGRPRLFAPSDRDEALLLGDYLYAHGLTRVAETGHLDAVRALAELISRCAQLRADGQAGDGEAWAVTARSLGDGASATETAIALRAHTRLVD